MPENKNMIYAFRYTEAVWDIMNHNDKKMSALWETENQPASMSRFIIKYKIEHDVSEDAEIMPVVIGAEYIKWLKENKMRDSRESKICYASGMTDAEIMSLARKNEMDMDFRLFLIPAAVLSPCMDLYNFSLKKPAKDELMKYLESIYGKGSIYIPGCIVDIETAVREKRDFIRYAQIWHSCGTDCTNINWAVQYRGNDTEVMLLCIPYVFIYRHEKPSQSVNSMKNNVFINSCDFIFKKKQLKQDGIRGAKSLSSHNAYSEIAKCFQSPVMICDKAYFASDAKRLKRDFAAAFGRLKNEIK